MPDPTGSRLERDLARILQGGRPTVLDLFAGCGGLSLGFELAGFHVVGAVEEDAEAAHTYSLNRAAAPGHPPVLVRDIQATEPAHLAAHIADRGFPHVDVIVAGPPCQAFARIGRAKLREIQRHPEAWHLDGRASLYEHFVSFVAVMKPLAVLLENVPDVLTFKGRDVPGTIASELAELGYDASYTLLNAAHYGVPQTRERFFLLGYRRDLGIRPRFPTPLRNHLLPSGYREIRAQLRPQLSLDPGPLYTLPLDPNPDLPPAVTCGEALQDLPAIREHLIGGLRPGMGRQQRQRAYRSAKPGDYGLLMRRWPGFPPSREVTAHAIRITPRDFEVFRRMLPGDQYPRALEIALQIFQEHLDALPRSSRPSDARSPLFRAIKKATVPPYDPSKFPGKWQKLDSKKPSHTITAHLGRDCYSHIHPDSRQARTISVREAARLQSFPDSFRFDCSINTAFKQIGNAVPPLLALAVASCLRASLAGHARPEQAAPDLVAHAAAGELGEHIC